MSSFGYAYNWGYYPLVNVITSLPTPDGITNNFSISISPSWYNNVSLLWTVPSDWGTVIYNVYSGPTEVGPFTKLNETPLASPQLIDYKAEAYSKYENVWYVVEAIFPDNRTVQSPPTTWNNIGSNWVNIRIKEIQRREWLLLRKFVGIKTLFFRRKTNGTRCSRCWNQDTKRTINDKCGTCYGTSWEGGYYEPFETLVQYDATPNDVQLTYLGKLEQNQIQAWTIAFPEMLDFDLLYRVPDKRMYRVSRVLPTELTTKSVRQILVLTELSKESVEHKLAEIYD